MTARYRLAARVPALGAVARDRLIKPGIMLAGAIRRNRYGGCSARAAICPLFDH
jgi:hypothetical protein